MKGPIIRRRMDDGNLFTVIFRAFRTVDNRSLLAGRSARHLDRRAALLTSGDVDNVG
jgi:hypothetical protein